jgi:hypothetical protein
MYGSQWNGNGREHSLNRDIGSLLVKQPRNKSDSGCWDIYMEILASIKTGSVGSILLYKKTEYIDTNVDHS